MKNIKVKVCQPPENFFSNNFKQKKLFNSGDGICIPIYLANLMMKTGNFVIKISSPSSTIYGKSVRYDAPNNSVILPEWMLKKLNIEYGSVIVLSSEKIQPISNIKFSVPKNIVDPIAILEFELRNRNILSNDDVITSKIFDKSYNFLVKEIKTADGSTNVGTLFDNNIVSNINFEIE